jgi:hypothetical protein
LRRTKHSIDKNDLAALLFLVPYLYDTTNIKFRFEYVGRVNKQRHQRDPSIQVSQHFYNHPKVSTDQSKLKDMFGHQLSGEDEIDLISFIKESEIVKNTIARTDECYTEGLKYIKSDFTQKL